MARLYTNENFPLPVVVELRALGHDVLTSFDSQQANRAIPDPEVLAYAAAENRILLTLNRRHFIRLHNANPNHSDMIVCTVDPDFKAVAKRIHDALAANTDMAGLLIRVNRPG